MATNGSTGGILSVLNSKGTDSMLHTNVYIATAIVVALALLLRVLSPKLDPREPLLVKPTIPLIGHIIGLIQHQAKYHVILQRKSKRPIATLPMLTGKMYAVWDPVLVAAGLRSKRLSATPHIAASSITLCQLTDETKALVLGPDGKAELVDRVLAHIIPPSMKGEHLQRMNVPALEYIGSAMSELADGKDTEVPNVWLWFRNLMMMASSKALYGPEDPFAKDLRLEQALWDFASDVAKLVLNFIPQVIAFKAYQGRALLVNALRPYYQAHHDTTPSASEFVRARARAFRDVGMLESDLVRLEIMLPFAAATNTVPSLFWFFAFVMSDSELVARLRKEVEPLVKIGDDKVAILSLANLDERCPLLTSVYRETLRVSNHQVSTRTVMQDTTLNDGAGNAYLLKKGAIVQMSLAASHEAEGYWGDDVQEFNADRFLHFDDRKDDTQGPGSPRSIRAAFQPFGGGIHLCPGRNFAYVELMAVMGTLLAGYDVQPLTGKAWKLPRYAAWSLVDAVKKPAREGEGFGVRVRRREGWDGVQWRYEM